MRRCCELASILKKKKREGTGPLSAVRCHYGSHCEQKQLRDAALRVATNFILPIAYFPVAFTHSEALGCFLLAHMLEFHLLAGSWNFMLA